MAKERTSDGAEVCRINTGMTEMTEPEDCATMSSDTSLVPVATITDIRVAETMGIRAIGIGPPETAAVTRAMADSEATMDDWAAVADTMTTIRPSSSRAEAR